MLAFSPGGEVAAQMAAQPSTMGGLEGLGAAGSESGRKHWRWVPDLPLPWPWRSSGSFAGQERVGSLVWNPGTDPDSFIPETHIEHVLWVSQPTRLSSGKPSEAGVVFILEPEPIPGRHVCLLSPRLTLFLTDGIFFFKNESRGGLLPAPR